MSLMFVSFLGLLFAIVQLYQNSVYESKIKYLISLTNQQAGQLAEMAARCNSLQQQNIEQASQITSVCRIVNKIMEWKVA